MQIFSANASESVPPKTVKSCEKTKTLPAEDRAVARHDRVPVRPAIHHSEMRIAVADEAVELDEASRVEELLEALAGQKLPTLALARDRALVAGVKGLFSQTR